MPMTAAIGDNSKALTEDEEKALFFHHLRKDMATKAQIDDLQRQRKSDRKLCQADGFALSRLDFAQKALDAEDKTTVTQKVSDQLKIMEWLKIIPGYNEDLFADRAPKEERVEGQGEIAGLAGLDRVPPYSPDDADHQSWLTGWDRGQGILLKNLEAAMIKKNSARSKEEPAATGDDPFAEAAE
jgi:hypothetical protein